MICTIGSTKGGVGKSTLAVNLAVALARNGGDVLLIDGDSPQETALTFTQLRADRGISDFAAIALHGAAIRTQVRQQLAGRYPYIVIDVGGRDSSSLRAALTVSQLLIVPAVPRSFDLWGVDSTAELAREAREVNEDLRALAVLNQADYQGRDNQEALALLAGVDGLEVAPCCLVRRKAYPNAAALGLSVLEHTDSSNPDGVAKAREEFAAFINFLDLMKGQKQNDHRKKTVA
jgi:chromosome partitioning protein